LEGKENPSRTICRGFTPTKTATAITMMKMKGYQFAGGIANGRDLRQRAFVLRAANSHSEPTAALASWLGCCKRTRLSQPGAVLGTGAMQKMLPLRKILAGFRKAAVEPTWRAAFNVAVSTRGRGAQKAGFATWAHLSF
jgi:hypothetical protein